MWTRAKLPFRNSSCTVPARSARPAGWMKRPPCWTRRTWSGSAGSPFFFGQARFVFGGNTYYLLDTPGHADFTAEMERALRIIDFAVLVVSSAEGIQAHTETIWRMLRAAGAPVFLFLNKTDRAGADPGRVYAELRARFSPDITDMDAGFTPGGADGARRTGRRIPGGLSGRRAGRGRGPSAAARRLVGAGRLFPCLRGAALRGEGVDRLLRALDGLTETHYDTAAPFGGTVYRVAHDGRAAASPFSRCSAARCRRATASAAKDTGTAPVPRGGRYEQVQRAEAGMLCGAVGLDSARPGMGIGPRGRGGGL